MKRILITGANRGLGLELVRQHVLRGDRVFATCRTPEKAAALAKIASKYPDQATVLPLEVTDQASLTRCADEVAGVVAALDIIYNNAAIHLGDEHLSEAKAETLLKTLEVNAVAPILVAQAFIGLLQKGDTPRLVNISSEAGSIERMAHFRGYNYYGSKAALNMYTRSLAWDSETAGVTIIAVHPGWVRTDMGGPDAHLSTEESAVGVVEVTAGLSPADNGKFYTWEGQEYPW